MNKADNAPPPVKLKGVGDSLWVTFNPSLPQPLLQSELDTLFKRLNHLATNARIVLDPGEQNGHDQLIKALGCYLQETYHVGFVSKPPEQRSVNQERIRTRDMEKSWGNHQSDVLMMTGRVRSGQKITAKNHFVLMGDINPGGEIIAGGDIIVMGSLKGAAYAGQPGHEEAIIMALDFRPSQVQIGGFVAAGLASKPGNMVEYAHVENGAIVVDDYLKQNPFAKIPWPQVR